MANRITRNKKDRRINVRVPGDLLRQFKEYTAKKNTTVTQRLIDHMTNDLDNEAQHGR